MKIALIGNGYWGKKLQKYIPQFFDLEYIADSKFDKNIIWDDKEVGSVIIATPIDTHYEIAKEALLANKHIYVEKPITMKYDEAIELKELAEKNGLRIGVDYTQTFSPSVNRISALLPKIGDVKWIEITIRHLGRFMEYDVHWLLASHGLSILSTFINLDEVGEFKFCDYLYHNSVCTTGQILFDKGYIDTSLNWHEREMCVNIYGEHGNIECNLFSKPTIKVVLYNKKYKKLHNDLIEKEYGYTFNESDNLKYSIAYFKYLIDGKARPNIDMAIQITKILEHTRRKYEAM